MKKSPARVRGLLYRAVELLRRALFLGLLVSVSVLTHLVPAIRLGPLAGVMLVPALVVWLALA